jgi:hypothetical protein
MSPDPNPEIKILPPPTLDAGPGQGTGSQVELALAVVDRQSLLSFAPGDPLFETAQKAGEYIRASKAAATRRAYDSDWRHFEGWCGRNELVPLPAEPRSVALYIAHLASPGEGESPRKAATISRRLTSINTVHKMAGLDSPATMNHRLVAATFHGIRRTLGTAQTRKKPLTRERLIKIFDTLEGPIAAARNKALLLIGFAGALRPVGAGGHALRRRVLAPQGHHHPAAAVEDRPGGLGPGGGDSLGSA